MRGAFQEGHLALWEEATWAVCAPSSYNIKGLMGNSLGKLGASGGECVILLCSWTWGPQTQRNVKGFHQVRLRFAPSSKPFYDTTYLEIEASLQGFPPFPNRPLFSSGPQQASSPEKNDLHFCRDESGEL